MDTLPVELRIKVVRELQKGGLVWRFEFTRSTRKRRDGSKLQVAEVADSNQVDLKQDRIFLRDGI
jgi:hypothetical protein